MTNGSRANLTKTDVLIVIGLALAIFLIWRLSQVLLLLFAAMIVAVLLHSAADWLARHTPVGHRLGVVVTALCVAVVLGVFFYFFGAQISGQLRSLFEELPQLADAAGEQFNIEDPIAKLQDYVSGVVLQGGTLGSIAGYTTNLVGVLGSMLLVVVGGIYLAIDPQTYRAGLLMLVPEPLRERTDTAVGASARALRLWLLGQLIAMVVVGTATTTGLYLIGVPSALALGLLAGLLEFVPFFGPVLSAVPAVLVALPHGWSMLAWVVGLYVVVQQVENNLLVPIIQRRTVDLPPVLGLFSVIALGIVFGPLGILFGTPLTVVLMVLTKYIYVRETLNEETTIAGLDERPDDDGDSDTKPPS